MIRAIDNFFLPVGALDQAREFYGQTLELALKFDFAAAGMAAFSVGEQEPAIILKDTTRFPQARPAIWLVVDDVGQAFERLKSAGVSFLSEPFPIRTGHAVEFLDPFGNLLGFTDYAKGAAPETHA